MKPQRYNDNVLSIREERLSSLPLLGADSNPGAPLILLLICAKSSSKLH